MISNSAIITIDHTDQGRPTMLRPLLFAPAATWLTCALQEAGVTRFLLLTRPEWAEALTPCFPEGTQVAFPEDWDEAVRSFAARSEGELITVTQPLWLSFGGAQLLTGLADLPQPEEAPMGIFRQSAQTLAATGDLEGGVPFAPAMDDQPLVFPIGDDMALHSAQYFARMERVEQMMLRGVQVLDPQSVYIDPAVTVGEGTLLLPNVILRGNTHIGPNCEIGPSTMIRDCTLGEGCVVNSSQLNEAMFGSQVNIGPYAYVRPGTVVADGCKVGDFVEVKNAVIGKGTKLPHLIYVGDSDVGERCNFGCGSITCNYDGKNKHRTTVGDDVFIGCNTNLVAPVTVESGAYTAAGSTITDTVPADNLAIGRARQVNKTGWQRPVKKQ